MQMPEKYTKRRIFLDKCCFVSFLEKLSKGPKISVFLKGEMTTASILAHESLIAVFDYRFIVIYGIWEWITKSFTLVLIEI